MRVAVTGGRDYSNDLFVFRVLDFHHSDIERFSVLINGYGTGLDAIARRWAELRGVPQLHFAAAWNDLSTPPVVKRWRRDGSVYNAAAGPARNGRMIRDGKPDLLIHFAGGDGTADMVRQCLEAGIKIVEAKEPR